MRGSRRVRRELARQMAKEILQRNDRPKYRTDILQTFFSICVPLGWGEIIGGNSLWRTVVGWILWSIPLSLGTRLLMKWGTDRKMSRRLGFVLAGIAWLPFIGAGAYSIRSEAASRFILTWPGLVLTDNQTRVYYLVAKRESFHNVSVTVLDNSDVGNVFTFTIPELDPRNGGLAESFGFRPKNLGHERMTIIIQSADGDFDEKLAVETRGYVRLPSLSAVVRNSRTGRTAFQCESADFPNRSGLLPRCANDPMAVK